MEPLPSLVRTERLVLRPWTTDDAPTMSAAIAASVDHLRPFMPWIADEPLTVDARLALIEQFRTDWESGGDAVYGVFLDDAAIGGTGLHRRRGATVLDIGYWVHVDHIGNGYATEIAAALTTTALEIDGIDTVEIHHDRANERSRRVPQRLGYELVGETIDVASSPGDEGVDVAWRMTIDRWPAAAGVRTQPR
ncbi:MAG: GNAT family N-acetyltransferase [Ilumatobacteraceae bacterium]